MCKTDIYKILEYENRKNNFFAKKNHNAHTKEEFSSYEEEKYGRDLCKIYEDLYKINYGKKYIKEFIAVLFLYIMNIIFNKISTSKGFSTHNSFFNLVNILLGIFIFTKALMFKNYYSFLLYKYIKLKNK